MQKKSRIRVAASLVTASSLVATASLAQNNVEYTYDDLGRVSTVCYLASADLVSYQYDATGNRSDVSSAFDACGPTYFSIADSAAVTEGGVLNFTVSRAGNTSVIHTLDYVGADGTATSASDYTAVAPGTLSFGAGETEKTIVVQTTSDSLYETTETMFVNLSNPTNGASITDNQAIGTINNDDVLSGVNFLISDASVAEGGLLSFTVTKGGPTSLTHAVDFATANGTATTVADYTATSGTLSFAPSETSKTVTVTTADDTVYEGNETVLVNLSNATNGAAIADSQGVGTITENDATPSFAISDASVAEGGTLVYTVTKAGSTAFAHTVSYATANGTAIAGSDYTSISGSLSFAAAETSKTISVVTTGDIAYENNETVVVNLSSPTSGATVSDSQGVGTIINDDSAPTFAISDAIANAGSNLTFTITKSGSTALAHNLNYATANGTALAGTHYIANSGSMSFASSETSKTISVSTIVGSFTSGSKNMYLNLSNLTGGATFADSQGVGTINAVNRPPVAVNDSVSGDFIVLDLVYVYVRNNDSDPDGDPLTVTAAYCVSSGCSVSIASGGAYIRVRGTTVGSKKVNYTISDGRGGTASAQATVSSFSEDPCPLC